jgi:hypothetical protein
MASCTSPVFAAPSPKYASTTLRRCSSLKVKASPAATGVFAPSMLVFPKIPSSGTPLCSAESRPFDSPVAFAYICAIITPGLTPFIRNVPRSRCSGQM